MWHKALAGENEIAVEGKYISTTHFTAVVQCLPYCSTS